MGEAKQRRLAREAGKPWECDAPKPPATPRYLGDDGQWHDYEERKPKHRPNLLGALLALASLDVDPSQAEARRREREGR